MAAKGLCAPNRQWEAWNPGEIDAIIDLKPSVLFIILYNSPAWRVQIAAEKKVLKALPGCRFIYRAHFGDDVETKLSAIEWARECHRRLLMGHPKTHGVWELVPANELNLPAIEGDEDWPQHILWLKTFATTILEAGRDLCLHLPALSPLGDFHAGWAAYAADDELMWYYPRRDVHEYPFSFRTHIEAHALFSGGIDITEFHFGERFWQYGPGRFDEIFRSPFADSACYLRLSGEGHEYDCYNLLGAEPYYTDFKKAKEGIPMFDLREIYPVIYQSWRAEAIRNNDGLDPELALFRDYLIGQGHIDGTIADIEHMLSLCDTKIAEVRHLLPQMRFGP